jgi:tRNA G37 N-methylase TrmD
MLEIARYSGIAVRILIYNDLFKIGEICSQAVEIRVMTLETAVVRSFLGILAFSLVSDKQ